MKTYDHKSQYGQDQWLENYFQGKKNGTFVEIGAFDGVGFSNTYFFEKKLDWTGICIEPLPHVYERLVKNRSCVCLNICVAGKSGEVDFWKVEGNAEMLSGLAHAYHPDHKQRIDRELAEYQGKRETLKVKTLTLNSLLEEHNLQNLDYCSIDTEGSELEILSAFDFNKFNVKAFSVENNYKDPTIDNLFLSKGYRKAVVLECDSIFVR